MAVLLGIDVGTTNWKAAAFSEEGRLLAIRTLPTAIEHSADGQAYYEPVLMWKAIAGLIREVVRDTQSHGPVDAVAVTGMGEAVVAIDAAGEPVGHIVPWFDTRSAEQADRIRDALGAQKVFEVTGLECNPIFTLAKIMWIRENQPEIYAKVSRWLSVVDYINLKLTGVPLTDYTEASRTLMLDLRANAWSGEMLAVAGVDQATLPDIEQSGTRIGTVAHTAARETGLPGGVQVVLGGHDHLCGSLAAGVLLGRRVLDSSGTAESIVGFSEIDQPLPAAFQGLRLGRYLDPRRWVTWGGIIASGRSVDWAIDTFASLESLGVAGSRISYDAVNAAVAQAPLGSRGLLYLSHLRGCGAPYWNPRGRGALVGLRDTHTQADCLRAVIEGLCFEARLILEVTEEVFGSAVSTLSTTGGGARSSVWQQIKADVTGKEVEIPEVEEATVLGAALLAGIGVGIYRDQVEASQRTYRARTRYTPNPANRDAYDALYQVHRELYGALLPANLKLAEIQDSLRADS